MGFQHTNELHGDADQSHGSSEDLNIRLGYFLCRNFVVRPPRAHFLVALRRLTEFKSAIRPLKLSNIRIYVTSYVRGLTWHLIEESHRLPQILPSPPTFHELSSTLGSPAKFWHSSSSLSTSMLSSRSVTSLPQRYSRNVNGLSGSSNQRIIKELFGLRKLL